MKLPEPVNIAVHVGVGFWVGWTVNDPEYRVGGIITGLSFGTYQVMGAWRKGDEGYPEMLQFSIGLGAALLTRRALKWLRVV